MFAKQQASLANPLSYGHKIIGSCGDMGELEYLLLSTHLSYIAGKSITISDDHSQFKCFICFCLVWYAWQVCNGACCRIILLAIIFVLLALQFLFCKNSSSFFCYTVK